MSIKFDSVELTPQHVIGGQGFLMAVQLSIIEGMQLALASFSAADEGWQEDGQGLYVLEIEISAQAMPLGVFEDVSGSHRLVANVDMSFVSGGGTTTITMRAFEKFDGVLGVLTK